MRVFRASDCHLAAPGIAVAAQQEQIYRDERFSDHAPLTVAYDFRM